MRSSLRYRVTYLQAKSSMWGSNISRSPLSMDLHILVLSSIPCRRIIPFQGFLLEVASKRKSTSGLSFLEQALETSPKEDLKT